jgi:hypothetical protein
MPENRTFVNPVNSSFLHCATRVARKRDTTPLYFEGSKLQLWHRGAKPPSCIATAPVTR